MYVCLNTLYCVVVSVLRNNKNMPRVFIYFCFPAPVQTRPARRRRVEFCASGEKRPSAAVTREHRAADAHRCPSPVITSRRFCFTPLLFRTRLVRFRVTQFGRGTHVPCKTAVYIFLPAARLNYYCCTNTLCG